MEEEIKRFLKATDMKAGHPTEAEQQIPPPPPESPVPQDARVLRLPEPGLLPDKEVNFLEMIEMRASVREYSDKELTLQELSFLLWCTQGVKMALENGGTMRTVPSAGARHAFETYLLVHRVEGIPAGLYRFLALGHALLPIANGEEADEALLPCFRAQNMVKNSAVTFLWCADYRRMNHRFGPRSARYIYLDAGHVCQNLYLAAYTHRIGVCAVGAFDDGPLNAALGLDGENDFAVYGATVGKVV